MHPNFRAFLLSAGLLLVFLAVALLLQGGLQRRAGQVRAESARAAAERVLAALTLAPRAPQAWDQAYRERLSQASGTRVELVAEAPPGATNAEANGDAGMITFQLDYPGHAGWWLTGELTAPGPERLQLAYRRAIAGLVLLGVLLALVPLLGLVLGRREPAIRAPWRAEAAGLERFARLTVERGAALEREHGARMRAEEDLQVSRHLLDRSLEDRIRLGRELHDNISQTLYAVCLTLESIGKHAALPTVAEQRLTQSLQELRRLNREVRAYIRDLEPDNVRSESFAAALREMLATVAPDVTVEQRVEDEALRTVPPHQVAELINLVREAVSNSVRHGRATSITVRAAQDGERLALVIADNGTGFSAPSPSPGHGLANMRARAAALGGELQIESSAGKGTRVLLTLPLPSSSA